MRPQPFEPPQLFVVQAGELPLSGHALLELMRAVLARGLPFRFCARGWSMAPFIRDGDVITMSPLRRSPPGLGEVVAFVRPQTGNLVVHRVVARCRAASLVQGDAESGYPDPLVLQESLVGRVTRVERNGRDAWLGLGPERVLIAWLSRLGQLTPLRGRIAAWRRPFLRKFS